MEDDQGQARARRSWFPFQMRKRTTIGKVMWLRVNVGGSLVRVWRWNSHARTLLIKANVIELLHGKAKEMKLKDEIDRYFASHFHDVLELKTLRVIRWYDNFIKVTSKERVKMKVMTRMYICSFGNERDYTSRIMKNTKWVMMLKKI